MVQDEIKSLKERVNLRIWVIALITVIIGVGLLWVSANKNWFKGKEVWQTLLQNIGALMFVTTAITIVWELFAKRALLDEVLAKAQISKELTFAGIIKITYDFYGDVDWRSYFETANKLDLFFAYARSWSHTHEQELKKVAARQGARIRVVLPDPNDEQTVNELARRFSCSTDELKKQIEETVVFF